MDWRNLHGFIDVSPFMLFESTGDSEEDSDLNMSDNIKLTYDEVDDAQSCCSDSSEIFRSDQFQEHLYSKKSDQEHLYSKKSDQEHTHDHDYDHKFRDQNDFDEDENDDDGVINQDCRSKKLLFGFLRTQKKSKVCSEPVKKEEKDKLFWDTCLAS